MKRIATFLILSLLVFNVQAQRIHAYLVGGATISQIEGDELKGFKKWGGTGGVGAMVNLTDNGKWLMSVETNFAQRGVYNKTNDPFWMKMTLNYIDIPVSFFFHDTRGGMTFGAGFLYGRLIQQPHGIIKFNPEYVIPDTVNLSKSWLKNDFAFLLDFRFRVWRGLQLNLRWQYSLVNINWDKERFPEKEDSGWHFSEKNGQKVDSWVNKCHNSSISARIIWEFGSGDDDGVIGRKSKRKRR